MVTVRTHTKKECEEVVEFPKLMISTFGDIVYFRVSKCGTWLKRNDGTPGYREGEYSDTWNMGVFKDYNDCITLQNKIERD